VTTERIDAQLAFIRELDGAKHIERQNDVADRSRRENDAEHMWHLAVMALVLSEHAADAVDVLKVITMLVLHDVVEIDAGDVFVYDETAREGQEEREAAAADRIYGLLPDDQAGALRAVWDEFEAGVSAEARFARALDRLHPLILNHASGGAAWRRHGVTSDRVIARNAPIGDAAPPLWEAARRLIADAVEAGSLMPGPDGP
jgi:putative hydrolases of HD superfamily